MPDQKPPRLTGDERATLHALLQFQRESLVRTVSGVDEAAAASSPLPTGTSLLWLTVHLAWAEQLWIVQRFAGRPLDLAADATNLADAVAAYRAAWARVDAIVDAAPSLDEACADGGPGDPVNLRWVLMHLLEETARHAGHADVLRELIDGSTGR